MSYNELYGFCQEQRVPVSRKAILPKIAELTGLPKPKMACSGLDVRIIRGFMLVPGAASLHPLARYANGAALVVVARDLNYCWRRFVVVKELMHLFDTPLESVGSSDEFETLLSDMTTAPQPQLGGYSPPLKSEINAFWMALALLCPETKRHEYMRLLDESQITHPEIAEELKIPLQYVPSLFLPRFPQIVEKLVGD